MVGKQCLIVGAFVVLLAACTSNTAEIDADTVKSDGDDADVVDDAVDDVILVEAEEMLTDDVIDDDSPLPDMDNFSRITKQWGTAVADAATSVVVDAEGHIYIAGYTKGDLDGNKNAGGYDVFLAKLNMSGDIIWTRQWGTSADDIGFSVAIDANGDLYVVGQTAGSLEGNASVGEIDIFLTKWRADGTKGWTRQWGTPEADSGASVAIDSAENIYVTGMTNGSFDGNTNSGWRDIFLSKWRADGIKVWTKQWGTSDLDEGTSVSVDLAGNIYVTGNTAGSLDGNIYGGGDSCMWGACSDVFLTKWSADGTKAWTRQRGATGEDRSASVVVGGTDIYMTGQASGPLDESIDAGNYSLFLLKWNNEGSLTWFHQEGGAQFYQKYGVAVAVDSTGSVYVAGDTLMMLTDQEPPEWSATDIFLAKWNGDGTKAWTEQWGAYYFEDRAKAMTIDASGTIYVVGYTASSFDGNSSSGVIDIFLSIISTE